MALIGGVVGLVLGAFIGIVIVERDPAAHDAVDPVELADHLPGAGRRRRRDRAILPGAPGGAAKRPGRDSGGLGPLRRRRRGMPVPGRPPEGRRARRSPARRRSASSTRVPAPTRTTVNSSARERMIGNPRPRGLVGEGGVARASIRGSSTPQPWSVTTRVAPSRRTMTWISIGAALGRRAVFDGVGDRLAGRQQQAAGILRAPGLAIEHQGQGASHEGQRTQSGGHPEGGLDGVAGHLLRDSSEDTCNPIGRRKTKERSGLQRIRRVASRLAPGPQSSTYEVVCV